MGIREKLNDNPGVTTGVTAAIVVIAVAFIIWQLLPSRPSIATKDYYTVDDGATYFKDDIKKVPPFVYEGKEAVRVRVFRCAKGGPFVGYLEKYTPTAKKQLEAAQNPPPSGPNGPAPGFNPMMESEMMNGRLVKKPGDKKWVSQQDPAYQQVVDVKCPDGSTDIELVTP
jgi:hypothetical protein